MPFDPANLFTGIILACDRVLQERDGTLSAIRIFDLLNVPQIPIQIQIRAIIQIKCHSETAGHLFEMTAEHPDGSVEKVTPVDQPLIIEMKTRTPLAGSKPGAQIVMELGVAANAVGTYVLRALLDGIEIAKTTLTLQLKPQQSDVSQ